MSAATDYCRWIADTALPFWADMGFDELRGRFAERLSFRGHPLDVPQRSMVQARQIFVFAHAAQSGLFPDGARLAEVAMASLRRDFEMTADGMSSFAFSIATDGRVVSDVRDTYAHAFILLAIAWLYRVTGDPALLSLADRAIAYCDTALADNVHGGFFSQNSPINPEKQQNPQMHLLEAFLALDAAAAGRGYLERAERLVSLFVKRLFDREQCVVFEHFNPDWSLHNDAARRYVAEPGHLFEWVWLLRQHALAGGTDHGDIGSMLDSVGRETGFVGGLVVDEIGHRCVVSKGSHRLWPHTEAIKAAVVRTDESAKAARPFVEHLAGRMLDTFLDRPFEGGWIDHIDAGHRPLVDYVPASSLYHLVLAATEMERAFEPS